MAALNSGAVPQAALQKDKGRGKTDAVCFRRGGEVDGRRRLQGAREAVGGYVVISAFA